MTMPQRYIDHPELRDPTNICPCGCGSTMPPGWHHLHTEPRASCLTCRELVAVRTDSRLRPHGPNKTCPGGGHGSSTESVESLPHTTLADIRDLGTIPVWHATRHSAASLLRMSRGAAYKAAKNGDIPTMRLGSKIVVLVQPLRRLLSDAP